MNTGDIAIIITFLSFLWGVWRERRKPDVDQADAFKLEAEAEAEAEAAKKAAAERRKLEDDITTSVLLRTAEERKDMLCRIDRLERNSIFWTSFAREYWTGSRRLHAQVVRANIEPPEFIPADKFPTGPLDGKAQS